MIINKYKNFSSERLLESLVLESNVYFSNSFLKILGDINSEIATQLISMQGEDFKTDSNYIDIEDGKNDTVSFIPDKKAQELIKNRKAFINGGSDGKVGHYLKSYDLFEKYKFPNPTEPQPHIPFGTEVKIVDEFEHPRTHRRVAYVVSNDKKKMKAIVNIEQLKFEDGSKSVWVRNRNTIKIGRLVKKLLALKGVITTDKEIETFVNMWKAQYEIYNDVFKNFEVVKGNDIRKWYLKNRYYRSTGTLGNSCMQYDECQEYFDCYCNNTNVSMVIQKAEDDKEKISGRAILWTLDDGMVFMDRIYTINDSDVELFKLYAKQHGWAYKNGQNSMGYESIVYNGETISRPQLLITLSSDHYSYFPYMDTMKFFGGKILSNFKRDGSRGPLEDTDGNSNEECSVCNGDGETTCPECDGRGRVTCHVCDGDRKVECPDCSGEGKENCEDCDGNGTTSCNTCDGEGKDEDGKTCEDCDGSGDKTCDNCAGEGKTNCSNCDGECKVECPECNGRGTEECYDCSGNGTVDCYECS